jgi:D-glycero-alpha-D-manno-heptose 1-phosphate guanylyltransferase
MEAIVLAGGFGTRLKTVVSDIPKSMAPIGKKPFLEYLFHYLSHYNISNLILCTGYKHESILTYFGSSFNNIPLSYSIENEPLGTGGALIKALSLIKDPHFIVINGDSFFKIDIDALYKSHVHSGSDFMIALKPMSNFDRYGTVQMDGDRIIAFKEKCFRTTGLINGGIYSVKKSTLQNAHLPKKCSLEKDFLEKYVSILKIFGKVFNDYFIDIGIPEDYFRAEKEFTPLT